MFISRQRTSFDIYKVVVYTIYFVFILSPFSLFGQKVNNIPVYFNNYDVEDGLPSFVNNCVFEGHRSFLWIGTDKGFSRFDGKEFVNYSAKEFGLSFSGIDEICEDEHGELWLSERKIEDSESYLQLFIFNPDTEKLRYSQIGSQDTISCFVSNSERQIVLGTTRGKLILIRDNQEHFIYQTPESRAILEIVSTVNGYWLNEGKKVTFLDKAGKLVQNWNAEGVFTLVGAKDGYGMYVEDVQTEGKGQYNNEILLLQKDNKDAQVTRLGAKNLGLEKFDSQSYLSQKGMFVVTDLKGEIFCIDESGERKLSLPLRGKSPDSIEVKDVLVCSVGNIWIATTLGIFKVNFIPSKFHTFLYQKPPLANNIKKITAKGDSLYCVMSDGEIILDLASETFFSNTIKPRNEQQVSVKDKEGQTWFVKDQTLSFLDETKNVITPFQKYNQFIELATAKVFDICDVDGVFWVATNKGLYKMTPSEGVTEWYHSGAPTPDSRYLPADVILGVHQGSGGNLWLTTLGSGVIRLDPEKSDYQQIMVKDGLAHNTTNAILEDEFGFLWISTDKGITRINKKEGSIANFDKSDGLPFDKFNKNASAKLADGKLVFAGVNGVVVFDPEEFLEDKKSKLLNPLRVVEVIVGDSLRHALDLEKTLFIDESITNVAFNFKLMHYQGEEAVIYEWKWEGKEQTFKELPNSRLILSDIPRGGSNLLVRARLTSGRYASNDLKIRLKTPAFLMKDKIWAGGILIAFFAFFMYQRRTKTKETKEPLTSDIIPQEETKSKVELEEIITEEVKVSDEKEVIILSPTDKRWLREVTEIAEKQLQKNISSVEELAKEMNLSSRQLNRKMKQLTGSTPNQFLRGIKLAKAKYLLENGLVATVAETSHAVGFEKPDYFSRLFHDKYGIRPVSYFDKK